MMSQRTIITHYQAKNILNKGKRADHWFWTRYSAYPYMGCQHGCAFCYCREKKYIPHKPNNSDATYDIEADEFSHLIKIKDNAAQLLHKALSRVPVDMVFTGDYQPAERKHKQSRQMLEVCLELGFPVFVLTRSPLVLRDVDLLKAINEKSRAVVAFSIITTPDGHEYATVSQMEGLAPATEMRFIAMEQFAKHDILTGTVAMPLLPGLCNHEDNIRRLAQWTASHGGKFIIGSGLTLANQQKEYFLRVLSQKRPELLQLYARMYPEGSYTQAQSWRQTGLLIREHCLKEGIFDRIPRSVIPGEKRQQNKRIVEYLANRCYWMELENAPNTQVWATRNAAWAIEDLEQEVGLIYRALGRKGLESIPYVTSQIAREIEGLFKTKVIV